MSSSWSHGWVLCVLFGLPTIFAGEETAARAGPPLFAAVHPCCGAEIVAALLAQDADASLESAHGQTLLAMLQASRPRAEEQAQVLDFGQRRHQGGAS